MANESMTTSLMISQQIIVDATDPTQLPTTISQNIVGEASDQSGVLCLEDWISSPIDQSLQEDPSTF